MADETDVTRVAAALGAPAIRYRSFGNEAVRKVTPAAPPASPEPFPLLDAAMAEARAQEQLDRLAATPAAAPVTPLHLVTPDPFQPVPPPPGPAQMPQEPPGAAMPPAPEGPFPYAAPPPGWPPPASPQPAPPAWPQQPPRGWAPPPPPWNQAPPPYPFFGAVPPAPGWGPPPAPGWAPAAPVPPPPGAGWGPLREPFPVPPAASWPGAQPPRPAANYPLLEQLDSVMRQIPAAPAGAGQGSVSSLLRSVAMGGGAASTGSGRG
ncbi:hypothetical protein LPC08_14905 [Roseomonas sp. OT10]|uniref:hypothetical protein n=1 Tax=Roseomonas cutis TaxID=2897332 RepID=UPI001E384161|nr:hypothetical protein [Roseomonas sp. OT10]UFN47307.1 hypothetical protein LPC08_14905 [Roseomonas sp. OT10]